MSGGADGRRVAAWAAGLAGGGGGGSDVAGWHCSWCLDVAGIRTKLTSAQNGDFPRWGDYPDRLNASYIEQLVAAGVWFDNVSKLKRYDVVWGPPSLMANERRYWPLIHNVHAAASAAPTTSKSQSPTDWSLAQTDEPIELKNVAYTRLPSVGSRS